MNIARKNTIGTKLLMALLAVALVFTMMPLSAGFAFAADAADYQPALTITGPDGTKTEYQTREDVIAAFGDPIEDDSFGVALKGIAVKRLLKGYEDDAVVTVGTQDNYDKLNASGKTVKELKDSKGLLAYEEAGTMYDPTSDEVNEKGKKLYGGYFKFYVGKDSEGKALVDKWVNRITIENAAQPDPQPDPQPVDVLTVKGEGLDKQLAYDSIKTLKNDESIVPIIIKDAVFKTVNSAGTQEEFTVDGVTIENLIRLAGVKETEDLVSVTATANDGYSKEYTKEMIMEKDADGNQAMFIWTENGAKVQKTAIGLVAGIEQNRKYWVGGDSITLTVATEAVKAPAKVTIKSVKAGKKKATVTWKKSSGAEGYIVTMATKKNGKYKTVKTIKKASTTKCTVKKLKKGKTYYFKVTAYKNTFNGKAYSKPSAAKKVKIKK